MATEIRLPDDEGVNVIVTLSDDDRLSFVDSVDTNLGFAPEQVAQLRSLLCGHDA